ncbi:MAG TPA: UDP-N-acetylglucosamine 2-epimerase [Phycisphaerae bacterium]|nr:UDP-N-acetylglucosamine 2-epimerase [Phycisphaerae bacterium]
MSTATLSRKLSVRPTARDHVSWLNRIACISTSRADAGIYRPLLRALAAEEPWSVSLLAGGTHFDESFGETVGEFDSIADLEIHEVRHFVRGDNPTSVATSTGQAVGEFARAIHHARPDMVFVLGDRTEMLAAALAATIHDIPIAHLHGGDTTVGACDDACRHAITKLSHLHFPAIIEHGDLIAAMNESRWRIHAVGALALDSLKDFVPLSRDELYDAIGVDFARPTALLAFYPETLSQLPVEQQIDAVCQAVRPYDGGLLLIGPNADVGHAVVRAALQDLAATRRATHLAASLTQRQFWSALAHATALIGNSSAGILEAASFRLPVVNIGDRQKGRVAPNNVIHAPFESATIRLAIQRANSREFRQGLSKLKNPYGDGNAAGRILEALWTLPDRRMVLTKTA